MFRLALALILMVAPGLAACGDDNDESVAATTVASAEDPSTTVGADDAPAPTVASGDLEAWCLGWNGPPIPEEDGDVQGAFEAILAREEATAAVAPAEIAEANQVWLEGTQALVDHLESFNWDLEAADARNFGLDEPEVDEARETLDDYAINNC